MHNEFEIITYPRRTSDWVKYELFCRHPLCSFSTDTITLLGAKWQAKKHTSEQRVLANGEKVERYDTK